MNGLIVRSALFVPATRPERISKALTSGADRVIVDLEDAVQENLKDQARENLDAFLQQHTDAQILVRINAVGHRAHEADLALCQRQAGVAGILLPKAESAAQVLHVGRAGAPVWPIIESAKGLAAVAEIARTAGVERLAFGSLDLALDLNLADGSPAAEAFLNQSRHAVLLHTRVAGLAPALDGVFPSIGNVAGLKAAISWASDMGFGGALCIHPSQVATIHQVLSPPHEALEWARRVIEGAQHSDGVFTLDGQMIDAPVIARARSLLARAL